MLIVLLLLINAWCGGNATNTTLQSQPLVMKGHVHESTLFLRCKVVNVDVYDIISIRSPNGTLYGQCTGTTCQSYGGLGTAMKYNNDTREYYFITKEINFGNWTCCGSYAVIEITTPPPPVDDHPFCFCTLYIIFCSVVLAVLLVLSIYYRKKINRTCYKPWRWGNLPKRSEQVYVNDLFDHSLKDEKFENWNLNEKNIKWQHDENDFVLKDDEYMTIDNETGEMNIKDDYFL